LNFLFRFLNCCIFNNQCSIIFTLGGFISVSLLAASHLTADLLLFVFLHENVLPSFDLEDGPSFAFGVCLIPIVIVVASIIFIVGIFFFVFQATNSNLLSLDARLDDR